MITAIILAAGESKRMGQPKMLLPWGKETVLSHMVTVFREAGVDDIFVVTGGARERVENAVSYLNVKTIFNKEFAKGEMLSSIQCGIRVVTQQTQAILIGLGDQPQVQVESVRLVCELFRKSNSSIVVPSFQKRRGHPWLVARPLWKDVLELEHPQSPRDFLDAHHKQIHYVNVDDQGILADLDTPEDYKKWLP
jgi:molybdenum cofactor cytidylyltransferase